MNPSSEPSLPPKLPPSKPAPAEGRFRFSKVFARWWWLATIFIAAITYTVTMIPTWMEMDGPLYESTALIEVKPIIDVTSVPSPTGMAPSMTRQFMNTQFEIIVAPMTLELALAKNDLLQRLGGDKSEAINRMKKSIRTTQRRGTDLIEISYRDSDAQLARDGAVAVYEAYKDRRYELEMNMRKEQLKAMKFELQNKTDRVQELRKRLRDIAEKAGLIWVEDEEAGKLQGSTSGLKDQAEKELYEAQGELRKLTFQINKLLPADDEELLLLTVELPNVGFKEAYKKYEEAIKEVETMKASGLAEAHPDIKMRRARLLELRKSMEKRAINIRESLKRKLVLTEKRVKQLRGVVNGFQDEGVTKARSIQELNVARKEYEMARSIKDQMEMKYDVEKTRLGGVPQTTIVHQLPEQAGSPATRGREFFVTLGTVCSLPFSIGLGILLMYAAEMIIPRRG